MKMKKMKKGLTFLGILGLASGIFVMVFGNLGNFLRTIRLALKKLNR